MKQQDKVVVREYRILRLLAATTLFVVAYVGLAAVDNGKMAAAMLSNGSSERHNKAAGQTTVSGDAVPASQDDGAIVLAHSRGLQEGWVRLRFLDSVKLDNVPKYNDTFNGVGVDYFKVDIDVLAAQAAIRIRPDAHMQFTGKDGQTKTLGRAVHKTDSSAAMGYNVFLEWPRKSGNFKELGANRYASDSIVLYYKKTGTVRATLHIQTNMDWTEDGKPPKPGRYTGTMTVEVWGWPH